VLELKAVLRLTGLVVEQFQVSDVSKSIEVLKVTGTVGNVAELTLE
jgi:hypothetical protein